MSLGWWREWRRKRILARRAIPDALWDATLAHYPFLAGRTSDERARLRELATLFLAAKEFSGAGGLVVTDAMAVAISAQACLPVLELGLDRYAGFIGIVVHADAVVARREHADDVGVVHEYDEELSGEAMHGGPVMLAWSDVDEAGNTSAKAYNVVVHEFAHVLDMHSGLTEGAHERRREGARGAWLQSLVDEYDAFCVGLIRHDESLLDPYAGEAVEEFFAVAAEAFFAAPRALQAERPRLYELLREVFRQDPALTLA